MHMFYSKNIVTLYFYDIPNKLPYVCKDIRPLVVEIKIYQVKL